MPCLMRVPIRQVPPPDIRTSLANPCQRTPRPLDVPLGGLLRQAGVPSNGRPHPADPPSDTAATGCRGRGSDQRRYRSACGSRRHTRPCGRLLRKRSRRPVVAVLTDVPRDRRLAQRAGCPHQRALGRDDGMPSPAGPTKMTDALASRLDQATGRPRQQARPRRRDALIDRPDQGDGVLAARWRAARPGGQRSAGARRVVTRSSRLIRPIRPWSSRTRPSWLCWPRRIATAPATGMSGVRTGTG